MSSYILDAYAWIEYLEGSARGVKVRNVVENTRNKIFTCAITLADSYVLACSRKYDAIIITGDPHFTTIKDVVMI